MEKFIILSIAISLLFCVVKYVEIRVLHKKKENDDEEKPSMKNVFRDGILVFICSIVSMFVLEQITPALTTIIGGIATGEIMDSGAPKVFTTPPDF
jgi:large-conductance mechanosensitive channel